MKKLGFLDHSLTLPPYHPWNYFLLFVVVNSLLSYTTFPLTLKLILGLIGIAIPFGIALTTSQRNIQKTPDPLSRELPFHIPGWGWILLITTAIVVRFADLTTLSSWPLPDEAYTAFYGLKLFEHWHFQINFGHWFQGMPLGIWFLGLFFKVVPPSLFSLWLFPAILSTLTCLTAYWAVRAWFPRSFTFFFTFFFALNFIPLYFGRFCFAHALSVLFELLAFLILGHYFKARDVRAQNIAAWQLGLVCGLGFYAYPAWPVVALFLVIAFILIRVRKPRITWLSFFIPFLLLTLFFLYFAWANQYGQYLTAHLSRETLGHWQQQLGITLSYLGMILWGSFSTQLYGPLWGGFLNPIAGSLLLIGLIEWIQRCLKNPIARSLLIGLFLFMLPGLITNNIAGFRIILSYPMILLAVVTGLQALWPTSQTKVSRVRYRAIFLTGLWMLISTGLDLYHIWGPYHRMWGTPGPVWEKIKEMDNWRAYEILKKEYEKNGPGLILTDFLTVPQDPTLLFSVYPFNASRNPKWDPLQAKWVALVTNVHYQPFLMARFPNGRADFVSRDYPRPDGGFLVFILPIQPSNRETLFRWQDAHNQLRFVTDLMIEENGYPLDPRVLPYLESIQKYFQDDPFLQTFYWERISKCFALYPDTMRSTTALEKALHQGYPVAHLWNELGVLYAFQKRIPQAREAFRRAIIAPLNLTRADENLRALEP